MKRVQGHSDLLRDDSTNAIINTNKSEHDKYREMREKKLKERNEIEFLKSEVGELKSMMTQILNKLM